MMLKPAWQESLCQTLPTSEANIKSAINWCRLIWCLGNIYQFDVHLTLLKWWKYKIVKWDKIQNTVFYLTLKNSVLYLVQSTLFCKYLKHVFAYFRKSALN